MLFDEVLTQGGILVKMYAYHVTKDAYFHDLWKNVVTFYMRTQIRGC